MEFAVGVAVALGVVAFGRVVGLDRDRAFYAVVLIVTASYYDLFAVMGGSSEALVTETIVFSLFVVMAVVGFKTNQWFIVGALVGHGALDIFRGDFIVNPGVPVWWPMFCLSFDVAAAIGLAYLLGHGGKSGVQAKRGDRSGFSAGVAI